MKSIINIVAVLSVIGMLSGGILQKVSEWAAPKIEANQKAETERGIFLVHPKGISYETIDNKGLELYKVFDSSNQFLGYSLAHSGNGFQGKIRIMVGLSPDLKKISSFEVLEQSETPGLGTIITEPKFKDQFDDLTTNPYIEWIKGTPPEKPNEIQTITGATISSKSIVQIMNDGISKLKKIKESGGDL